MTADSDTIATAHAHDMQKAFATNDTYGLLRGMIEDLAN
jgi:hypothetical protein